MKITKLKQYEIANVCYANVANEFAMFTNPRYRGENFTWDKFAEMCESQAEGWMFIHRVCGDKEAVNALAKQYAREIAERLVDRMGT
jgi:hypothetical protein